MSSSFDPGGLDTSKLSSRDRVREARGWERVLPVFLHRTSDGGWRVQIYWRRLLVSVLALAVTAWVALTAAAWMFVRYHRGVPEVTYLHIALPWQWTEYRVLRGNHYIRSAEEHLATAQWRAAYLNLRVGLEKNPAHREGRISLAQFYTRLRRYELATQTLLDGLSYHAGDAEYLRRVFHFLLQLQEDDQVLALARRYFADPAAAPEQKRLAALNAATAHFHRGNYDQAEDLLAAHQLASTRDARLLQIRLEWERGYRDLALVMLRQFASSVPGDDEIAGLLAALLRQSDRLDEARRLNVLRQLENPRAPRPRIDLLQLYAQTGDTARRQREIEDIFREFATDATTLLQLGDFAASAGDVALARRVHDHCKLHNLPWDGPALLVVEAAIVAKQYEAALALTRELLRENPEWSRRYFTLFNGLQAIAHFGLGDREAGSLFLKNFLAQASVRSEQLVSISRRLASVGAAAEARTVLAQAAENDPLNQAALSQLIEADLAAGRLDAMPENIRKLLVMRKPSPDLLERVRREVGRDRWLFLTGRTPLLEALETAAATKRP